MQPIKNILENVFHELQSPEKKKHQTLVRQWPSIAGPRVAPHTKPLMGKEGCLMVWVDQAALAFELRQKHQQSLLKRAQAVLGEETIKTVRFFVGQIR